MKSQEVRRTVIFDGGAVSSLARVQTPDITCLRKAENRRRTEVWLYYVLLRNQQGRACRDWWEMLIGK